MSRDFQAIESAFGLVDREVWIVTSSTADGRRGGLLATWIAEASIDRENPILLAGIAPNHYTRELIDDSAAFAAHLVTSDEISVALDFAIGSGRDRDKLKGIEFQAAVTGSPILKAALAWFDCRVFHRVDTGDRIYYWADVLAADCLRDGSPLRQKELFRAANEPQRKQLIADRDFDIEIQRPLCQAWRKSLA